MNYSEYLFGQLLQANLNCTGNVPYDDLYIATKDLYKCFEDSEENIYTEDEYYCMEKYIRNNEVFLLHYLNQFE